MHFFNNKKLYKLLFLILLIGDSHLVIYRCSILFAELLLKTVDLYFWSKDIYFLFEKNLINKKHKTTFDSVKGKMQFKVFQLILNLGKAHKK